jgi:hypothetical protein
VTRGLGGNSASDQKLQVVRHLGGRRGREEGLVRDVIGTVREHPGCVIKLQIACGVFRRPSRNGDRGPLCGCAGRPWTISVGSWGHPAIRITRDHAWDPPGLPPMGSPGLMRRTDRATKPLTTTRHPRAITARFAGCEPACADGERYASPGVMAVADAIRRVSPRAWECLGAALEI